MSGVVVFLSSSQPPQIPIFDFVHFLLLVLSLDTAQCTQRKREGRDRGSDKKHVVGAVS